MSRVLSVLLLVAVIGVAGFGQTAVVPRAVDGALLFDNQTGGEVGRLGILFDGPITLCSSDIIAVGGGAVTRLDIGRCTAWIDVKVASNGTLQITNPGNAEVLDAYWVASAQERYKIASRWLVERVWNAGDLDLIDEFMAVDFVAHGGSLIGELADAETYGMYVNGMRTSFPDAHLTIEDLVAEGDLVAIRATKRATHTGPLMTIPASGAPITTRVMMIYRFADGVIQEGWLQTDALGLLTQIGVLPPMGPPIYDWGEVSSASGNPGTTEENKAIASRDPEEIWNDADFAVIQEIIAGDYLGHYDMGTTIVGREAYQGYVPGTLAAFPDFTIRVEELFAEGDLVVFRSTASGTHLGPLGPIAPTGESWTVGGIVIRRMADGKIVELWQLNDMLSLLTQIGLVPPLT